jgi:enoyl-CoA hydratase/carnithine racemase
MWRIEGSDSDIELAIFTGTDKDWIIEFESESWKPELMEAEYTRYEHVLLDGRRMLSSIIQDVEVPTIGVINGSGGHAELALMCDICVMADDAVIANPHLLYDIAAGDGIHSCLVQLLGVRRAACAMDMSEKSTLQQALEYGLLNEVVPYDRLSPRGHEIADFIMARHRAVGRLTAQVVTRPWKKCVVDDLDMTLGTEMLGDVCTNVEHANVSFRDYFFGEGDRIWHDVERARQLAEESKRTERSKTEQ